MRKQDFTWRDPDGVEIFVYVFRPAEGTQEKGVVQIAHGMGETAHRYKRFAQVLTEAGYIVFANDHRGHGRTAGHPDKVGIVGNDGFAKIYHDLIQLTKHIHENHPQLPIYILGHSMGSFLVQKMMYQHAYKVKGVILSGTNGKQGMLLRVGQVIATIQSWFRGHSYRSTLLDQLSFGKFNGSFRPNRTAFDWLSRDEAEVDAYIANPCTGKIFSALFFRDFFGHLLDIHKPKHMALIPKHLPILMISGACDPVSQMGKGVEQLKAMYEHLGCKHVTCKIYPESRHELLNELNRDEVTADILNWLNART